MTTFQKKIRDFRNSKGLTQEQFAEELGIKKSLLGAYEEGRATPPIEKLMLFSDVMGQSLDQLIQENQSQVLSINFDEKQESVEPQSSPKPINEKSIPSVEKQAFSDEKPTPLIESKDFDSYVQNFYKPEFIINFPRFNFPLGVKIETRAFKGLENTPNHNAIYICSRVDMNFDAHFPLNQACVITTKSGILYRTIYGILESKNRILIGSDSIQVSPKELPLEDLLEIWKVEASFIVGQPNFKASTEKIDNLLNQAKAELKKFDH